MKVAGVPWSFVSELITEPRPSVLVLTAETPSPAVMATLSVRSLFGEACSFLTVRVMSAAELDAVNLEPTTGLAFSEETMAPATRVALVWVPETKGTETRVVGISELVTVTERLPLLVAPDGALTLSVSV